MTDATELDEAAIRARVEAATPGPWRHTDSEAVYDVHQDGLVVVGSEGDPVALVADEWYEADEGEPTPFHDAEFIAHARTDVGLLLTALDKARAQVERLHFDLDREARARQAAERERDEATEIACRPLASDHPTLIDAEKRGHERGWDAAREEYATRAEAAHRVVERVRDGLTLLLGDLAKAEPHHFSLALMCVRVKGLLSALDATDAPTAALDPAVPATTERSEKS